MTLFWESTDDYWEIPFYADFNLDAEKTFPDFEDRMAAREQLWALREWDEAPGDEAADSAYQPDLFDIKN